MDERVIFEKGVIRMTYRQLSGLLLDADDRCRWPTTLPDIHQPEDFTEPISFSVFEQNAEV